MNEMRLIVAGGRDFDDYVLLFRALNAYAEQPALKGVAISLVSGMARGADALAVRFARKYGVKLYEFPAEWNTHGKSAGFRRNVQMAQFADALLAFHDGESSGTRHMIETMQKMQKPVEIIRY